MFKFEARNLRCPICNERLPALSVATHLQQFHPDEPYPTDDADEQPAAGTNHPPVEKNWLAIVGTIMGAFIGVLTGRPGAFWIAVFITAAPFILTPLITTAGVEEQHELAELVVVYLTVFVWFVLTIVVLGIGYLAVATKFPRHEVPGGVLTGGVLIGIFTGLALGVVVFRSI